MMRDAVVIYLSAFLAATSISTLGLGAVFFLRSEFGAAPATLGIVSVTWSASYVVGCLGFRSLFKHLPKRLTPAASICFVSASVAGCAMSGGIAWFAVFYVCLGLALSFFWPMLMGWLAGCSEGVDLGAKQSKYNTAWCAGTVIGPYMAGWLGKYDPAAPLWTAAALFALIGAVMWANLLFHGKAVGDDAETADVSSSNGSASAAAAVREDAWARWLAWLGLFGASFVMGASWSIFPIYFNEVLGCSKPAVGGLFLVRAVANTAMFVVLGRLAFWHFRIWPMAVVQLLLAVLLLVFITLESTISLGFAMMALGVGFAFCYSNSVFHSVAGAKPRERTGRVGIHEAILSAAAVVGSILAGFIYQAFSMSAVFMGFATACVFVAVIQVAVGMFRPAACVKRS